MFKINKVINLNIQNFIILLTVLTVLVVLFNKAYIENNYVSIDKYKSIKKYKSFAENYYNQINELKKIIASQKILLDKCNNSAANTIQNIGNHTSAHNASLTPSRFDTNNDQYINMPLNNQFNAPSNLPLNMPSNNNFSSSIQNLINENLNNQIINRSNYTGQIYNPMIQTM
jgi:hypothetical protein